MVNNLETLRQNYIRDCIDLAYSMVIKLDMFARAVNIAVMNANGIDSVDTADPASWKYYLNISGKYHDTDTSMTIRSLDTGNVIVFSRNNLNSSTHVKTKRAYAYGSSYYKKLCAKYPEQTFLIRSIVTGISTQTALDATDATILAYDTSLVQDYENGFIQELQQRLYAHWARWSNEHYALTSDLYANAQVALLYHWLVKNIFAIRYTNSNTADVNDYFIDLELASHAGLNAYTPLLSRQQKLYLYQNAPSIYANAGKQSVLKSLIQNLLVDQGISAYSIIAKHDNSQQVIDNAVVSYLPEVVFKKIDYLTGIDKSTDVSLSDVISLTSQVTTFNAEYYSDNTQRILTSFQTSPSSTTRTKILVLEPDEIACNSTYTSIDICLIHWLIWALSGRYGTYISFTPNKHSNKIIISVADAARLFLYCQHKINGIELQTIPLVAYNRVFFKSSQVLEDIKTKVDLTRLTEVEVENIFDYYPSIPAEIQSVSQFHLICSAIYSGNLKTDSFIDSCYEYDRNAFAQNVKNSLYRTIRIDADSAIQYSELISDSELSLDNFTQKDYIKLSGLLFEAATNQTIDANATVNETLKMYQNIFQSAAAYTTCVVTNKKVIGSTQIKCQIPRPIMKFILTEDLTEIDVIIQTWSDLHPDNATFKLHLTDRLDGSPITDKTSMAIVVHENNTPVLFDNLVTPQYTNVVGTTAEIGASGNYWQILPYWTTSDTYNTTPDGLKPMGIVTETSIPDIVYNRLTRVNGNYRITAKVRFPTPWTSGGANMVLDWGPDMVSDSLALGIFEIVYDVKPRTSPTTNNPMGLVGKGITIGVNAAYTLSSNSWSSGVIGICQNWTTGKTNTYPGYGAKVLNISLTSAQMNSLLSTGVDHVVQLELNNGRAKIKWDDIEFTLFDTTWGVAVDEYSRFNDTVFATGYSEDCYVGVYPRRRYTKLNGNLATKYYFDTCIKDFQVTQLPNTIRTVFNTDFTQSTTSVRLDGYRPLTNNHVTTDNFPPDREWINLYKKANNVTALVSHTSDITRSSSGLTRALTQGNDYPHFLLGRGLYLSDNYEILMCVECNVAQPASEIWIELLSSYRVIEPYYNQYKYGYPYYNETLYSDRNYDYVIGRITSNSSGSQISLRTFEQKLNNQQGKVRQYPGLKLTTGQHFIRLACINNVFSISLNGTDMLTESTLIDGELSTLRAMDNSWFSWYVHGFNHATALDAQGSGYAGLNFGGTSDANSVIIKSMFARKFHYKQY